MVGSTKLIQYANKSKAKASATQEKMVIEEDNGNNANQVRQEDIVGKREYC